ncbi:type VI secretion protein IcmF/TssM N-terminal domain-containing protein [Enterobacter asburiae]
MLKKIISIITWTVLLFILFVFCLFLTVWSGEPPFYAILLWLGFIFAVYLVGVLRVSLSVLRDQGYLRKLISRHSLSRTERPLYAHWKSGTRKLKRAIRINKTFPWFVITGTGHHQSTLLAGTELILPLNTRGNREVIPARTLRWWFFRPLAFLELSTLFSESASVANAWKRMTGWFRGAPPLAGVIVCLPVTELLDIRDEMPVSGAYRVRVRLEPLLNKIRRRLPVYVLVTECDHMPGFSRWINALSTDQQQQPLGYYWLTPPIIDGRDPGFLSPLFDAMKDGLNSVRISMFSGAKPDPDTLCLLDIPERMLALQPALQRYITAMCENEVSAGSPAPVLGGVWFTATDPVSHTSNVRKSYFVGELFSRVLPFISRNGKTLYSSPIRGLLSRWGAPFIAGTLMLLLLISAAMSVQVIAADKGSDVSTHLSELARTDAALQHPVRYLPFISVLQACREQIENAILSSPAIHHHDDRDVAARYRQDFSHASPEKQRELILALARAVVAKEELLRDNPLSRISEQPVDSSALTMMDSDIPLTPRQSLLLQRALLLRYGGEQQVCRLRRLLDELVSDDPQWRWLLAPAKQLVPVRSQAFFPGNRDGGVSIEGIWTAEGTQQIARWLKEIRQATGEKAVLPAMTRFEQRLPELRQAAWIKFIVQLNKQPVSDMNEQQWSDVLLNIDQGNSPATGVANMVNRQLADISDADASPWLLQLRKLVELQANGVSGALARQVSQRKQALNNVLPKWLNNGKGAQFDADPGVQAQSWTEWQNSLRAAVSDALNSPAETSRLTSGLFGRDEGHAKNPLQVLGLRFTALRKNLTAGPPNAGVDAVWALYEQDKRLLIAHALYRSGCWLQQQWQSTVLWPLDQNARRMDYPAQQALARQYIASFIRDFAKNVLSVGKTGVKAGEFEGQHVALNRSFLFLMNKVLEPDDLLPMPEQHKTREEDKLVMLQEQQKSLEDKQKQLESTPAELSLHSLPATVPGGAELMPVGTQLILFCDDQRWSLKSMNFDEQALFRWRPGHCSRVTQIIRFPGFSLEYNYVGDSAWPDFLNDIAEGQHSYQVEDFPEQAALLRAQGIKQIMVRYQPVSQAGVQETWRQWKEIKQALDDNSTAQQTYHIKSGDERPLESEGRMLSRLPVKIANCP